VGDARIELDPQRELQELKDYLGDEYRQDRLEHYQRTLDEEWAGCHDEDGFYRTSNAYLYNLTAFAMTGTKLPYLRELTRHVPPGSRLLDYGCGIGSDGLMLLKAGYRVEFADFDNPSTAFLRWRLEQQGFHAAVHDLDKEVPGGFDAAYAFDVIEHVRDPWAFLNEMEKRAALVQVNLLEFDEHEQELHYELPIPEMLRYAAERGLEHYRVHYGSSHLIIYRPERVAAARRLTNRLKLAAERFHRPQ
jgi:SAM-dependent methyltransferase